MTNPLAHNEEQTSTGSSLSDALGGSSFGDATKSAGGLSNALGSTGGLSNALGSAGGFGSGLSSRETVIVNTDNIREFISQYKKAAGQWENVAQSVQAILDAYDEDAKTYTATGGAMPITDETRKILYEKLEKVVKSCHEFGVSVEQDCAGLEMLAQAHDENAAQASQAAENSSS